MKKNKDIVLVKHILSSIDYIEQFMINRSFTEFQTDRLFQSGVVRELLIVGEAAAHLSDSFQEAHPTVPFHKIIGMRNVLAHGYWEIDEEVVWNACTKRLPELKKKLLQVI